MRVFRLSRGTFNLLSRLVTSQDFSFHGSEPKPTLSRSSRPSCGVVMLQRFRHYAPRPTLKRPLEAAS